MLGKKSDKINRMDIIDYDVYYKRDQIVEREENDLESEESENYEIDKIENPESLKRIDTPKNR